MAKGAGIFYQKKQVRCWGEEIDDEKEEIELYVMLLL